MGEPMKVRPRAVRSGDIRITTDLGTRHIKGHINKPSVTLVIGRDESHKALMERAMLTFKHMVPMILRDSKK